MCIHVDAIAVRAATGDERGADGGGGRGAEEGGDAEGEGAEVGE